MKIDGCTARSPFIFLVLSGNEAQERAAGKIVARFPEKNPSWSIMTPTLILRWRLEYSRWLFSCGTSTVYIRWDFGSWARGKQLTLNNLAWHMQHRGSRLARAGEYFREVQCHLKMAELLSVPMRIGTESYPATWKWHGTCWGDSKCKGRVWWQDQRHGDGDVSTSSTYSRVGSFRGKASPGKRQLEKKYVQLEKKAEETFPLMSSCSIWKPTSRRPRLQMLSWINASNRPWSCSRPVRGAGQRFKIFRSAHEKLQRRKMSVLKSPKMLEGLRSRCWTNRPKAFFFLTSIRCRQMFQRFSRVPAGLWSETLFFQDARHVAAVQNKTPLNLCREKGRRDKGNQFARHAVQSEGPHGRAQKPRFT